MLLNCAKKASSRFKVTQAAKRYSTTDPCFLYILNVLRLFWGVGALISPRALAFSNVITSLITRAQAKEVLTYFAAALLT